MKIQKILKFLLLLTTLALFACSNSTNDSSGNDKITFNVTGIVKESSALEQVTVSAGGKTTKTDLNGFYKLDDVPVPSDGRVVMTFEKDGYATYQRSVSVEKDQAYSVAATLLKYQYADAFQADAAGDKAVDVTNPENPSGPALAKINFPEGSIGVTGEVSLKVATADATSEEGRAVFPGDYVATDGIGDTGEPSLESVAFTEITITDSNGNEVTTLEKPADIQVKLPDEFQTGGAKAGTYIVDDPEKGFIEWWSYDEENGIWIREDADPSTEAVDDALVVSDNNGVLYAKAKVTHFSWWNADRPISQHACIGVKVFDEDGNAVQGVQVFADGVSYNGRSSPAKTNNEGLAYVNVKKSEEGEAPVLVKLYAELGGIKFYYDVTDGVEGDVDLDQIKTPTQQGSTRDNSGQCVDLQNIVALRFNAYVRGRVTYEGSGAAVPNFTIYTSIGKNGVTDSNGNYEIKIPRETQITVVAIGLESQQAFVAASAEEDSVERNFIVPNRAPEITRVTRTPEGLIALSGTANLEVEVNDPDGNAITTTWSLSGDGSLAKTTGLKNTWTAPASGAGTDTITIVATDDQGASTQITHKIVWGGGANTGTVGGTKLKFIFTDENSESAEGIVVSLYNNDKKTIARTIVSNASGVVDFGDTGGEKVSYTIAYQYTAGQYSSKQILSYVDVPAGEYPQTVYLGDWEDGSSSCEPPIASPFFNASQRPDNTVYSTILPMSAYQYGASSEPTQADICNYHAQDDARISYLALAYDSESELIKYGQLLDQVVSQDNTSVIDIPLNKNLVGLGWSTNTESGVDSLYISGFRDEVSYYWGTGSATGKSGIVLIPADFPLDYHWLYASGDNSGTHLSVQKQYSQLPQAVQIELPDFNLSASALANSKINFSNNGSTSVDIWSVNISETTYSNDFSNSETVFWYVTLSGAKTSWDVMELPEQIKSWIDVNTLSSSQNYASITAMAQEIEDFDNFESYWSGVADGTIEEGGINRTLYQMGSYTLLDVVPIIEKPRAKQGSDKPGVKVPKLIRPLGEMWRR